MPFFARLATASPAGFRGPLQLLAKLREFLGGGDGGFGGGRLSVCGHWAQFPFPDSAWILSMASLMCAPTLAMNGSSIGGEHIQAIDEPFIAKVGAHMSEAIDRIQAESGKGNWAQ